MKKSFISIIIFIVILYLGSFIVTANSELALSSSDDSRQNEKEVTIEVIPEENLDETMLLNTNETIMDDDGDCYKSLDYSYNGERHIIHISSASVGVDISEYEYYFVTESYNTLSLYYSKTRLNTGSYSNQIFYGAGTICIKIKPTGTIESVSVLDGSYYVYISESDAKYIASNQNIYNNYGKKIFSRNCGYTYDDEFEGGEICEELIESKDEVNIYENPALNYDIIATMPSGNIIKRVKRGVNVANNHIWDKVLLINGKEAYVISDEFEINLSDSIRMFDFKYRDDIYNIYALSDIIDGDINSYNYYFVTPQTHSDNLFLYINKNPFSTGGYSNRICYDKNTILISFNSQGSILYNCCLSSGDYEVTSPSTYIASSHDIYYGDKLIFPKKFGTVSTNVTGRINSDIFIDFSRENQLKKTKIEDKTYSEINVGEQEYDNMGLAERLALGNSLTDYNLLFYSAAVLVNDRYPNASNALLFYLTKGEEGKTSNSYSNENDVIDTYRDGSYTSGHVMREISLKNMTEESGTVFNNTINNLNCAMDASEKYCINEDEEITFYNIHSRGGSAEKSAGLDWYLAVNNYYVKMTITAHKSNDEYVMKVDYHMFDYYDWDPNDSHDYHELFENIEGMALDTAIVWLEAMHRAGICRNYTNYGTVTYNVNWKKGERLDNLPNFN